MEEAVQCKVHIAALISEFLTKQNGEVEGIPANNHAFLAVAPNITSETGLPNISLQHSVSTHVLKHAPEFMVVVISFTLLGRGRNVQPQDFLRGRIDQNFKRSYYYCQKGKCSLSKNMLRS